MYALQLIHRPSVARVSFALLLTLAFAATSPDAALGQHINLQQPSQQTRSLHLQFPGEQPRPLAMVSGDFDEDGVNDLVIGYGLQNGGMVALLRGNRDAIAPQTEASWLAAGRHEYSDAFVQASAPVSLKTAPSMLVSADVNGDGHLDLVYASQGGSTLQVLLGTGQGTFLPKPASIQLPGTITALTAYRPGAPVAGEAVMAAYESHTGAKLGILRFGNTGWSMSATYSLPAAATMLSVANFDGDFIPDTAIVAGGELLVLHGKNALTGGGHLEALPLDGVESVASGEFIFDRHAQLQISAVTSDGTVHILAHQGFDSRPYTPQQIAAARRGQSRNSHSPTLAQIAGNTGSEPWVEVESHPGAAPHTSGSNAPILLRSRLSGSGGDDLVVLNSSQQQRVVIGHSVNTSLATASAPMQATASRVSVDSTASDSVVAAVSTRVSPDGRPGVVTLKANEVSPEFTVPSAGNTYYVNTTSDNAGTSTDPDDGNRCTSGSAEVCTLRDAVTFVNNDATDNISGGKSDTIMVPSGTYPLTWQKGTLDANGNALSHLEILGPVTIIGSTSGGGVVINAESNDTVFTINPGSVGSFNPSGNSYVFDTTLENLTIENGKNSDNPGTNDSGLTNDYGGGINWDAFGTGNLTLSNSTVENCSIIWGAGGGIWAFNSAGGGTGTLTLNGSTISNNSTSEQGGGVFMGYAPTGLSATNTTFSGNLAEISVNPSDPGGAADVDDGGGLFLIARGSATPETTLTGVTITSNVADGEGGGINTTTALVLSGSVVNKNSSGSQGGGVYLEIGPPEVGVTITSTNILQNSAATTGGGVYVGNDAPSSGNSLQMTLSRIFGNTSGGTTGLAVESPGTAVATENWWGCNAGPTNASCDRVSNATTSPYAQFGLSATNSTTVTLGGSLDLAISLNRDSSGNAISGAFPAVAANYPYTFAVTGVTASPALTSGTFDTTGSGTATLTPSDSGSGTVSATFDNQTESVNFSVGKPVLTVTANNAAREYGAANPAFGYTITGFVNGDNSSVVSGSATETTTATSTSAPGGYPISFSTEGLTAANYTFTYVDGTLTVSKASQTISIPGTATTTYGVGAITLQATASSGLPVTYSVTGPATVSGSTLTITGAGTVVVTANQAGNANYTAAAAVTQTFLVGQATLVATANNASRQFDTANPVFSYGITGFVNGDNSSVVSGSATETTTATALSPVGTYPITFSSEGLTAANYTFTYVSGTLTVFGKSQTTIAALTPTTATIDVFGFGFTAPSGQLSFTDVTSGNPIAAPVTLNTATAATSLLPEVTTSTGDDSLPDWTTLADVNGDGKADLITSVYGTDSVNVQLGNGNGTFQAATSILIAPGFGPAENHLVSLRGNGTLDLIVASFNTNQIAVLLGNGNGTFEPPVFYTVGSSTNTPTSLTTGDFNHDGNLDVAVANTGDNTVSVLLGNGSGALTPLSSPIHVGHDPEAIRAGDFNGDGYSDLAVANYADGTVTTLVNNQNGTFAATVISVGSGAASGPQALAIQGTGSGLQLAVANYRDNTVSVMNSNGNGTFGTQKIVSVGRGPDDVSFADFNGDGIQDLAVSNYIDGTVNVVLGSSGGNYTRLGPFSVGDNPYSAAVGDVDLDGTPDIAVSNCFSNNTGVLLSGTQIAVPYSGLSLTPGDTLNAAYTPDGNSKYGSSTSPNVTAP